LQGAKHRVARGETLASIAKRYNTSPEKLKELNGLASLSVKSGQLLTVKDAVTVERAEPRAQYETAKRQLTGGLPSAIQQAEASELSAEEKQRYVVRSGDTLSAIAKKTGSSVDKIKRANKLKSGRVVVGQVLVIP
jgi:LysM repeat protein